MDQFPFVRMCSANIPADVQCRCCCCGGCIAHPLVTASSTIPRFLRYKTRIFRWWKERKMTIRNRSTKSRSPMCAGTQSPNLSKVSANTPGHSSRTHLGCSFVLKPPVATTSYTAATATATATATARVKLISSLCSEL